MNESDAFDFQRQLLQKEMETIQSKISAYDDLSFKIKGWAVTLWSGVIVVGVEKGKPSIVGISIVVVLAFWLLDTYFKSYQRRLMARMGIIEDFLNSQELTQAFAERSFGSFPIHDPICRLSRRENKAFAARYAKKTAFWTCFRLPNVALIYLALSITALVFLLRLMSLSLFRGPD